MGEPERLIRLTRSPNEFWYHTEGAAGESLVQEAKITYVWTQALEIRSREDAYNVDEDTRIEDGVLEIDLERAQVSEYLTQEFVTRWEVREMIASGME